MLDFLLRSDVLLTIVAFALVLIPAVIIHELGHFLAAKAVGITILEFGIGMPPRALKLGRWRGTDITLNWLPLGGFVRPMGEGMVAQMGEAAVMDDRTEALARGIVTPRTVSDVPPLSRILFMAAGAIFNFFTAFILFIVIALMGLPQVVGGRVNVFYVPPASAYADAGLLTGDIIEQINGENFADTDDFFVRLASIDGAAALSVRRADVADPLTLYLVPSEIVGGEGRTFSEYPLISGVEVDSPAAEAGLQSFDLVTAFNREPLATYTELQTLTREHLGEEVTLTILRANETLEITLVPRANPPEGQGAMGIGISAGALDAATGLGYQEGQAQRELVPQTFGEAVSYGVWRIGDTVSTIVALPARIVQGTAAPEELRPASVLGISQVGGIFLQESIQQNRPGIILEFIALISFALGLTNLLPIPALDGGRIVFVLIEMVRRKPIAPEREAVVHFVGLMLLLSLMVVVLLNDIANPLADMLR